MVRGKSSYLCWGAVVLCGIAAGCTTTRKEGQFPPLPRVSIGTRPLTPIKREPAELLREAGEAFKKANELQEKGDQQGAYRQYMVMLKLLIEADLDPRFYYNQRTDFARILERGMQEARRKEIETLHLPEEFAEAPVASDLPIPFPLPPLVLSEIEKIQQEYPRSFRMGLSRSSKYLPYIREQFAKAGLPEDLVWLAMVESQFTPKIVSRAGAGGMWQFMPDTAKRYNLRMDRYVDERFHWQKATHAAIAYLRDLYEKFGENWPLAITGYNMGENGVDRAVAMNRGDKDLWSLVDTPPAMHLFKAESREFYPKLIATILVARNPERYGLDAEPQSPDECILVPVKGMYSLSALDKAAGLPSGTLARLNPDLIRGVTPEEERMLFVPAGANERLLAALRSLPQTKHAAGTVTQPPRSGAVHIVKRGETLSDIALRHDVSLDDLRRVNKITSDGRIVVGRRLTIPGKGAPAPQRTYRVQRGDTLYDIAKKMGVETTDLQAWNRLGPRSKMQVGDILYVSPPSSKTAPAPMGKRQVHVVKAGESPGKIAEQYGVKVEDLLRWNNLSKDCVIHEGDRLEIYTSDVPARAPKEQNVAKASPSPETMPTAQAKTTAPARKASAGSPTGNAAASEKKPSNPAEVRIHVVAPGDTASTIAAKHGVKLNDFLEWNGLTRDSVLQVGRKCLVSAPAGTEKAPSQPRAKASVQESEEGEKIVHVVTAGENPTTIARRYGVKLTDLFRWNQWDKDPVLLTGSKVIVYRKK